MSTSNQDTHIDIRNQIQGLEREHRELIQKFQTEADEEGLLQNKSKIQEFIDNVQRRKTDIVIELNHILENLNKGQIKTSSELELSKRLAKNNIANLNRQNEAIIQNINNKRRMIEINNFYANKNSHISRIIQNLIIITTIILIITLLKKKNMIPDNIASMIIVICISVIIIYVSYSIYDINIRDRFNFVQYKIPFSRESKERSSKFRDLRNVFVNKLLPQLTTSCIGEDCCDPDTTIYDSNLGTCIKRVKESE